MRQNLKYAAVLLFAAAIAFAGTIKVWGTNDVLTASDLNANFAHIHNLMVGGHGGRLVDADVNAGANIAYTKIQTNPFTPTAWANISTTLCPSDGGTCVVSSGSGVTSVGHPSPGTYTVNLSDTGTGMMVVQGGSVTPTHCVAQSPSSNPVAVICTADTDQLRVIVFTQ